MSLGGNEEEQGRAGGEWINMEGGNHSKSASNQGVGAVFWVGQWIVPWSQSQVRKYTVRLGLHCKNQRLSPNESTENFFIKTNDKKSSSSFVFVIFLCFKPWKKRIYLFSVHLLSWGLTLCLSLASTHDPTYRDCRHIIPSPAKSKYAWKGTTKLRKW